MELKERAWVARRVTLCLDMLRMVGKEISTQSQCKKVEETNIAQTRGMLLYNHILSICKTK